MSECVVRMEMPKSCPCELAGGYDIPLPCFAGHGIPKRCKEFDECAEKGTKPDWCPFICQLPDGHGRLVDADKEIDFHVNDFERLTAEDIDVYSNAYSLSDLCDGITYAYDHADIIVPAEAERSET